MTHRKREYQHLSVIMCGEYFRDDTQFFFFLTSVGVLTRDYINE